MAILNRDTLKSFFLKNNVPTEDQFKELINSGINMAEDHIFKRSEEPLSIEVGKVLTGRQTILNLHRDADSVAIWGLELNPGKDTTNDAQKIGQGFSISNQSHQSRFFINESEKGEIGIGTIVPTAQLHISNPDLSLDKQEKVDTQDKKLDGALLGETVSLELGERKKGNLGTIRLNGYDAGHYSFIKAGKTSLELDSVDGKLKINSDTFMHNGVEGMLSIYDKNGDIGTQLTSDETNSFLLKGNVGIGTATPSAALDVNGFIKTNKALLVEREDNGHTATFQSNSATSAPFINFSHNNNRSFYIQAGENDTETVVQFVADSADQFRFHSGNVVVHENLQVLKEVTVNGNVGINNINPTHSLDVDGTINTSKGLQSKSLIVNQADPTSGGFTASFNSEGEQSTYLNFSHKSVRQLYLQVGKGVITFQSEQGNNFIFNGGKVGINNANPRTSLHIGDSGGGNYREWMKKGLFIGDGSDGLYLGMKYSSANRSDAILAWGDDPDDKFQIMYAGSGVAEKEVMTMLPSGDVTTHGNFNVARDISVAGKIGINNPNPSVELEVNGFIKSNQLLIISKESSPTNGYVASFNTLSTEAPILEMKHNNTRTFYLQASSTTTRFVADQASKFQFISGDVIADENVDIKKDLNINGSVKIDNQSAIVFQRFNVASGVSRYNTGYSTNQYEAAIVGMRALTGDILESGTVDPIQVFMTKNTALDTWHISVDFASHNVDERWELDAMFVRKGLATRAGSPWHY